MNTTEHDKTEFIRMIRDMLVAHRDRGRDLDDVITYIEKTMETRLLKVLKNG